MNQPITIAFCATNSYADYVGTAIYSILKNNPQASFNFYIISSDITEYSKAKLLKLEQKNVKIGFKTIDRKQFEQFPEKEDITLETYFRFLLSSLLDDCDRILYLDSDILVTGDITAFYNQDLTDYYAAGVNEIDMLNVDFEYRKKAGFDKDDIYINAGVLLIDAKKWREDKIENLLFEKAYALKDVIKYQDQDIINITLKGKIKDSAPIYNFTAYQRKVGIIPLEQAVIIHYNWHKPWDSKFDYLMYNRDSFDLYHNYFKAYQDKVEDKISVVIDVYNNEHSLEEAIQSVLNQTYRNVDIICVYNESDDNSLEKLNKFAHLANFRLITNQASNVYHSYYLGLKYAKGDYVTYLSANSYLENNYLESLKNSMDKHQSDIAMTSFAILVEDSLTFQFFDTELEENSSCTPPRTVWLKICMLIGGLKKLDIRLSMVSYTKKES